MLGGLAVEWNGMELTADCLTLLPLPGPGRREARGERRDDDESLALSRAPLLPLCPLLVEIDLSFEKLSLPLSDDDHTIPRNRHDAIVHGPSAQEPVHRCH